MSYDLRIASPTGERKEGKFIFKIAQGGGHMVVEDRKGGRAVSKFIVRLDGKSAQLVPVDIRSMFSVIDELPPDWPELSSLNLADILEYPQAAWNGEGFDEYAEIPICWDGIQFSYRGVAVSVPPVTEDKKNRQIVAGVDVSWGTSEGEYRHLLQGLIDICEELGLELYDRQGFGVITRANLEAAVKKFTGCSSVICGVLGAKGDGGHDKAIADWTDAISLKPDDAEAYCNRGKAYGEKGDYGKAIADYAEAIRLRPDFAKAYYNRGVCYGEKGDHDKAIADYNEAIRLTPDFAEAYYNRGVCYGEKRDHDKAIADYTKAIRLSPDDAEAYYNRGAAYGDKGDHERAIADFTDAIRLEPDYVAAYDSRGAAYREMGKTSEAEEDFAQASKLRFPLLPPEDEISRRDNDASSDEYQDKDAQKKRDPLNQVPAIPVTDFELSVRTRNCLQKMGVVTLGDLCRCTEQELLASKNFSETSLAEIKEMLDSKNLRLGQAGPGQGMAEPLAPEKKGRHAPAAKRGREEVASELFGEVRRPRRLPKDEEYYVDLRAVSRPLTQEGTVIRACCTGCGYCLELYEAGAERLAKLAGAQKPDSWEGYYFEVKRCPVCDIDHGEVVLKHTRDLCS
jgi:tetratricopeptide (TPR) repeat protein